jgi:hypothetical protein
MTDDPYAHGANEITENHFTTEAEALAEIKALGWNVLTRDIVTTEDEDLHWHDFEAITFIVSGVFRAADEHGAVLEFGPGTRFRTGARFLHRELAGGAYRVVQGFKIGPADITHPINKPPEMLTRLAS